MRIRVFSFFGNQAVLKFKDPRLCPVKSKVLCTFDFDEPGLAEYKNNSAKPGSPGCPGFAFIVNVFLKKNGFLNSI